MIAGTATDVPLLTWSIFDGHGVRAAVTTREGGVSAGPYASLNLGLHVNDDRDAVAENRARVAKAFGVSLDDLVFTKQVHGRVVNPVTRQDSELVGDAMITTEPGPVLVVMAADCVPLVLFDPVRHVAAAVHAGWPGTVAGVTRATVDQLVAGGTDPADLLVGIGPSISPERYQVGPDVEEKARAAFGDRTDQVIRPDGTGRWLFDLWRANILQLTDAGVRPEAIELAGLDTGPQTPFFSHRSEGPTGRFAALVQLLPRVAGSGPAATRNPDTEAGPAPVPTLPPNPSEEELR